MPPQTPTGTALIDIPSLGTIKGISFSDEIQQFCGIPYADLSKRWSRSVLKTSLPGNYHDGTQHGPIFPQPPEFMGEDPMVPVPPFPHFEVAPQMEFAGLNLNVVKPTNLEAGPYPVMVWIHGGSFTFGGSTHPTYDMVNLVSHSMKRGTPVIGVSINYRVGLFGFLASKAIKDDLARDGFQGVGNFGLTDQQIALEWVQRYISYFGGKSDDVTIFGESAGGMSVAHQIQAAKPAVFHRGISMSGSINSIRAWTLEEHENRWNALLKYFDINPSAPDALEKIRAIPQEELVAATCPVEGINNAMSNTCDDGWFHREPPSSEFISSTPDWLKGYMVGDTRDEGMIFRLDILEQTYSSIRENMTKFLSEKEAEEYLRKFDMYPDTPVETIRLQFEEMVGDGILKIQDRMQLQRSAVPRTYGYHIDQASTLDNSLKGLAYHAIDLLYVFLNFMEGMTEGQQKLALKMSGDFIDFAHAKDPWERYNVANRWMIYGPNDSYGVKSEAEDEEVRHYKRMDAILESGTYTPWTLALDYIALRRWLMGTKSRK